MSGTSVDESATLGIGRVTRVEFWKLSLRPLALFLISRVGIVGIIGATALTAHRTVMTQLVGWDSKWYLMIAAKGYVHAIPPGRGNPAQSDLGFFPLMPLFIRGVHVVTGFGFSVAGIITSTLIGLLAAIAVWWFLADVYGRGGADRGTALIFLSPGAFVLSMVYSEGAIILFVACSLLALRRHRWLLAGLCAAIATSADPVGCAAIVPCAVAATMALRTRGEWRALVAPLVAPLGVAIFFLYLWRHTGSPLTWFRAQRAGWQGGVFGDGVPNSIRQFANHGLHDVNSSVKVMSALAAIGLVTYFFKAHPPAPWIGYALAVLAMGIASPIVGITPRLLLRDFPLLGAFGARLPPIWFEVILTLSTLALATLTVASGSPRWTP
jgi:hypothetical protein